MIITPLGHTEFLVDIVNSTGENVCIMVDAWLSDYALGDLMERTTRVRLAREKIKTIDAVYISHAHCDHFDPYTLVEIFGTVSPPPEKGEQEGVLPGVIDQTNPNPLISVDELPLLILPFTLRYLEPLLAEFLPHVSVHWLGNRETHLIKGIEITGYMWPNPEITNEDDVMMLGISSERELVFAEIDTVPDMEDIEVQKSLYKVFTRKSYDTACYLMTRNGLEGQIPYYDILPDKRKAFRDQFVATQKEEISYQYERYEYDEYLDFPNLFALPGFVRGFIGQGIAYPSALSKELASLTLFPLDELVSIENDYAKNAGYTFPQKALLPGRQYRVENGGIEAGRKECAIGELIVNRNLGTEKRVETVTLSEGGDSSFGASRRIHVPKTLGSFVPQDDGYIRLFASGPLIPRTLSDAEVVEGKAKILEILNTRFLPYWSASPVASLRDTLIKNNGVYRIECKISGVPSLRGDNEINRELLHSQEGQSVQIIFEYSTAGTGFTEVPYIEKMKIDEDYWMLDILDFLDGKLEMYSSFWHKLDPKKAYRLWTCLGASYMNHDLNLRKYRLHFECAKAGYTARDYVEGILGDML